MQYFANSVPVELRKIRRRNTGAGECFEVLKNAAIIWDAQSVNVFHYRALSKVNNFDFKIIF